MSNDGIRYPEEFDPANTSVFVRNEIVINASPESVWSWLTYASSWHQWYSNASNVTIAGADKDRLQNDVRFTWTTFGVNLKTVVMEFVPPQRLAWKATGLGIVAYHAWLIIPTERGCKVITEETQRGWLCRLSNLFMPDRMYRYHQLWLEGLKHNAEKEQA